MFHLFYSLFLCYHEYLYSFGLNIIIYDIDPDQVQ